MKVFKYIFYTVLLMGFVACEKHVVEYDTTDLSDVAEFQLHYFVPVDAKASNYIYKIEINHDVYVNNNAALLTTYNAVPNGSVGRFYTAKVGEKQIKLYKDKKLDLVYDQACSLKKGKQNVFVYDFNKPPVVFDNGHPYVTNISENTDSVCWVKFYNFLYEKEGVPTDLKLQYQYQYTLDYKTKEKSQWADVGKPVAFGETTGWQVVKLKKEVFNSSGKCRVDYRIKVIDASGDLGDELQVMNTNGKFIGYSDHKDGYIGRRYHHVLSGMRAAKPVSAVRQFHAL